ncbi:STAS domain-containing protein [Streptomyces wedmorensis]|uniref:STAS domain-containing protein n=1 Tax=Streptomyces wedmorensis TaxID=43759 RepID=UPI00343197DD
MTAIEVDEDEYGSWTVLRVRGELDLVTSPRIRRSVHEAVAGGRHDLVVDLSGVRFCDSSGVGVLIAARRLLRSCGGRLRLILPGPAGSTGSTASTGAGGSTGSAGSAGGGGGFGEAAGLGDGHVDRVLSALGVRRLFDVYDDVPGALTGPPDRIAP